MNTAIVEWDHHLAWFEQALRNPQLVMYIAVQEASPQMVGMCRFDIDADHASAEVSINLNPEARGRRLSQPLLDDAINCFLGEHDTIRELTARIRVENTPSRKIFEQSGFQLVGNNGDVARFRRTSNTRP